MTLVTTTKHFTEKVFSSLIQFNKYNPFQSIRGFLSTVKTGSTRWQHQSKWPIIVVFGAFGRSQEFPVYVPVNLQGKDQYWRRCKWRSCLLWLGGKTQVCKPPEECEFFVFWGTLVVRIIFKVNPVRCSSGVHIMPRRPLNDKTPPPSKSLDSKEWVDEPLLTEVNPKYPGIKVAKTFNC